MNHKNKMFEMKKPKKAEEKESSERLLRNTVEEKLVGCSGASAKMKKRAPEDVIHELQVHQIELKMQNEELRKSQLALEESRQRFADLYDFSPMGYFTLTPAALIKEVNLTGAILLGEDRRKLINSRFRRMVTTQDQDLWDNHFLSVLKQGKKQTCDLMLKRQDGSFFQAGLESIRMEVSGEATVIHTAVTDITERKQAEERERLAREVLDLLNRKEEGADSISDILLMVKSHTNFEAVGIRLSEGDDFPYYQTNGFSEDFVRAERFLCVHDEEGKLGRDEVGNPVLECMCGNILCGRTNPSLPFFTEGGSL